MIEDADLSWQREKETNFNCFCCKKCNTHLDLNLEDEMFFSLLVCYISRKKKKNREKRERERG